MLRYRMKDLIKNRYTLLGILMVCSILLLGTLEESFNNIPTFNFIYLLEVAISIGYIRLAIPIVTVVPYVCAYFESGRGGLFKSAITRTTRKKHLLVESTVSFLSGFIMVLAGVILFFIITRIMLWNKPVEFAELSSDSIFWQGLCDKGLGGLNIFLRTIIISIYGGMWSAFAFTLSIFVRNKYVVIALPSIVDLLLNYVTAFPYIGEYIWYADPGQFCLTGNVQFLVGGGLPIVLGIEILLLIIMFGFSYFGYKRRYKIG